MPVRRDKRKRWFYRFQIRKPDGTTVRISGTAEENTKQAALIAEAEHIARLRKEWEPASQPSPQVAIVPVQKKEVPKFCEFASVFLDLARAKNKPSEIDSKSMILRVHLEPAFKSKRLDEIGYAEIQDYASAKLKPRGKKPGLSKKTVNNHLTVLRRMLMVAKKRGLIESVPEVEWLRAPKPEFDFLSFEEAHRLVAAADDEWKCMIIVALRRVCDWAGYSRCVV